MDLTKNVLQRIKQYKISNPDWKDEHSSKLNLRRWKDRTFLDLKEVFNKNEEIYSWTNGGFKMQCNQKEILDFLNFHYKVETLGEDSFDLNLEGNPSSYLTFYSDKIFEGEGSIFYRDFFNLEEPFNCFFMNPENQIRFDKSSPLGPLIKKIVDDKIPAFFERVSLKKYEERDRFDLEGNPANIYLLNSILLK